MKKYITVSVILFLSPPFWRGLGAEAFAQQDAQYSQYMFNQLALNPAYAGSRDAINTSLHVRNQWTGIKGAPKTAVLAVQGPMKRKKVGLGLQLVSDKVGPKDVGGLLASYAYRFYIGSGSLAMGVRGGIYNYNYRWNEIDYKDQNEKYINAQSQYTVPTADAGLYYHNQSWYIGLSATHIVHSRITDAENLTGNSAELRSHAFLNFGKAFKLSESLVMNPSFLIKTTEAAPVGVDLNLNFLIDERLWLGASIRKDYGLVFLSQFAITEKFKLGYAYDLGFNRIGRNNHTHEIMIQYDFNVFKSKTLSPRYL